MATFNKFECFVGDVGLKLHNLNTDTLAIYLSNAAPSASLDAVKANLAEITNEHGYTAPVDIENTYSQTGGIGTLAGVDKVITADGGTVGPFQYVVLYNSSNGTDNLIGWWVYPASITLQDGETFTTNFAASILTIQ